jgi:tellurite resistance protein
MEERGLQTLDDDNFMEPTPPEKKAMQEQAQSLADIVLNVADGHSIEELKSRLQEVDPWPGEADTSERLPDRELAARLPAELADLPGKTALAEEQLDPFRTYFLLTALWHRLSEYAPSGLSETEQRAIRELNERLEADCARLVKDYDEDTRSALKQLSQSLHRGRKCVRDLLELTEFAVNVHHQSTHSSRAFDDFSEVSAQLEGVMAEVEEITGTIPDLEPSDLPSWRLMQRAHAEIIEPHRRSVFLFKSAVLLCRADGELSAVEREFLYSVAHRIHLSLSEAHRIVEQCRQVPHRQFRGTPAQAAQVLNALYACALADGVVQESERRMLRRIGDSLGVKKKDLESILLERADTEGIVFLDAEEIKDQLAAQRELPPDTYLPEDLSETRMQALRERLDIPPQDEVLLTYENRFLERSFECAALTTQHLCISPAEGQNVCIDLNRLDGFGSQIRSATLKLSNGKKIRLSRSGQGFLELLCNCLRDSLRSL